MTDPCFIIENLLSFQALVSLRRIEDFLLNEDVDPDNVQHDPTLGNLVLILR